MASASIFSLDMKTLNLIAIFLNVAFALGILRGLPLIAMAIFSPALIICPRVLWSRAA